MEPKLSAHLKNPKDSLFYLLTFGAVAIWFYLNQGDAGVWKMLEFVGGWALLGLFFAVGGVLDEVTDTVETADKWLAVFRGILQVLPFLACFEVVRYWGTPQPKTTALDILQLIGLGSSVFGVETFSDR